ncbi:4-coumarate-CoA ligase, putative [Phytophthora infestans T30-4]|uniref:4-coumarate-CoA ligase, putative n=1 Tax=Phytophthora infestans (strain T30-4) TaxID=403677 RepID=D0NN08_PHYIT|nr:4-coumarate-CoA ligase, putative [Phytophthora infestans T30-4]EEY61915.1 4-coumarate-CoA ligase, putative [Phytophthora infestans T30-4]|eukprot:XP_002899555.1 4-coumarate-CoA ligase, putative [Phytophthora infestans T30-4]
MSIIFKSPYPDVSIPDDAAIWNKLEQHAREHGDKPALVCKMSGRTLSFAHVFNLAQCICAGLFVSDIKKGDVVILHSFSCLKYPIVFLALNRLGAICSPSSPQFNSDELADQIRASKASAVISHVAFAKMATQAAGSAGIPFNRMFTLGHIKGALGETIYRVSLAALNLPFPSLPSINSDDVVLLPFSSGTTGRPKAVELTARSMYACGARVAALDVDADYILAVLPFFHIAATMIFHVTIFKQMAMIVLPRFEPGSLLRVIEDFKLDTVYVVPPIIQFLAKHPLVDKYDLSSLNRLASGAAPLEDELVDTVNNRLGLPALQSYGMTELAGSATHSSRKEFRKGSSGELLPNTELRVRCLETDVDLPVHQRYFNNVEATQEAFTDDGFIRTGDVGYIDKDGYIFIVERLKELIKYKGHQVAPAEIEDVVNSHPQVADSCCVRGIDLDTGDEIPKVFVVRQFTGDEPLTSGALMTFVASKVAGFKRVREVEFIDAIPKSLSGKILRHKLQLEQDKRRAAARSIRSRL